MGRGTVAIAVVAILIATAVAGLLLLKPGEEPLPPEPPYPEGITYDEETKTLSYIEETVWTVHDNLAKYIDPNDKVSVSDRLQLTDGFYTIDVNMEQFDIVVGETESRIAEWDFWFEEETHHISFSYEIDLPELAKTTIKFDRFNSYKGEHQFSELPQLVSGSATFDRIVSIMGEKFTEIGGDLSDRQSFADFLVSFAQCAMEYPEKIGSKQYDYMVWGKDEYWANALQTLHHQIGDCEDTAAVACSLFIAAGYGAAMVGVPQHVVAGIGLDSFTERTDIAEYNKKASLNLVVCCGTSAVEDDTDTTVFHGVDTTLGQVPVGYLTGGTANAIGSPTLYWGMSGFYPVHLD